MSEPYECESGEWDDADEEHRVADDQERADDWRDQFRSVE